MVVKLMAYTFGFDVSHYEPNVDWAKLRAAGVKFAFAKASQGIIQDDRFQAHRAGAASEGIPFGGYHFYDPRYQTVNPKRQAEFYWEIMRDDPGQLPLVVDLELYDTGPWHGWKYWYDFLERLKALAPKKEIAIYTGFYFWRDRGGPAWWDLPRHVYFSQYPLWIAYYPGGIHPPITTPEAQGYIPLTWRLKGWTFWQTSDQNVLDGVTNELGHPANVDYDFFNGDEAAFRARFDLGGGLPSPPVPPEVPMYTYRLTPDFSNGVSIRSFHDTPVVDNKIGSMAFGKIAFGDVTWGDGVQEYWLKALDVNGVPVTQESWIASIHAGKKVATITQISPAPVPSPSNDTMTATLTDDTTGEVWSGRLSKQ